MQNDKAAFPSGGRRLFEVLYYFVDSKQGNYPTFIATVTEVE
jgi:hypothetical protein